MVEAERAPGRTEAPPPPPGPCRHAHAAPAQVRLAAKPGRPPHIPPVSAETGHARDLNLVSPSCANVPGAVELAWGRILGLQIASPRGQAFGRPVGLSCRFRQGFGQDRYGRKRPQWYPMAWSEWHNQALRDIMTGHSTKLTKNDLRVPLILSERNKIRSTS